MQALFEFLPVLLFFIAFKVYGIYVATVVGIVATAIQVLVTKLWLKKWDKKQLITLGIFVLFGGMTLYFHNPLFVKWKPTIVFWIFALAILVSQVVMKQPLMQKMMEGALKEHAIPDAAWKKVNMMWAFLFFALGAINIYVAYNFSDDAWVNFKFYGITLAMIIASVLQVMYLFKYISEKTP